MQGGILNKKTNQPDPLRTQAEARLARAHACEDSPRPAGELLHELQVYQIELEMQNEALRQAQLALEESCDRYMNLYEFAPVGYLTLTHAGQIAEVNLTGAALLGMERKQLLLHRFAYFVAPEDSDHWHRQFMGAARRAAESGSRWNCELTLKRGDGSRLCARLGCLHMDVANGLSVTHIALTDISEHKEAEAKLKKSEERYRQIVQTSMDGFLIADSAGQLLDVNTAYCQMTGYTRDELLNMHISDVEAKESTEETAQHIREAMAKGYDRFETRHRRKDGQVLEIEVSNVFRPDMNGGCFFVFMRDITERKRVEEELRIAAIAFESNEGITVTDANSVIVRVNRAFTHLTGYSAEEVVGKTPAILQSGRHDRVFYQQMWATIKQDGFWQGEIWNRRKNGKIYAEWLTVSAVLGPGGRVTHYVGTFSDITQNSEAEAEIHRLAYYDPLTLLPNRRMLQDRLGQSLAAAARNGQNGAILFLDLDNFKTLNDTRGHDIGDMLLAEVAQRLKASVREMDTVARLGGDEFVVILEDLGTDAGEAAIQVRLVGEKLREALAQSYALDGREFYCTVSIGISLFGEHGATVEELLKHADLAMYHSKTEGRNTLHFFDPAMQAALDKRSALEEELRQALARGEFHLYYQPQVDGAHHVVGAEALLRWAHPERGLITPGEFIALAEETGLILPIGHWVLQTACAQLKMWEDNPRTRFMQLAVNVSARQFRQPDFVAQVRRALGETGADPTRLKIELTETLVLDDVADTINKMITLRSDGIGFSMDDFGTGYSSLTYLKQLPLDQLKIDKSFVRNLATDANDAAIVQAIITMGQTFGLDVIAEGVETEAQREFLGQRGCHTYQGYLFGKPVALKEFDELVLRYPDTD